MKIKSLQKKSTTTNNSKKRVQFKVLAPDAEEVLLAGSFNDWTPEKHPMNKDGNGLWKKSVTLPRGVHEYRLVIDGEWENDPFCNDVVSNDFGSCNNLLTVG